MESAIQVKLVVVLGNPGAKYSNTRHNAGWIIGDRLMSECVPGATRSLWQPQEGELFWVTLGGRGCLILKPTTFMNRSGLAVAEVIAHFGLSPREMLVISDDMDIPDGTLRLRAAGSAGGHRGVGSIGQCLQSWDFPRLRVGIGRPEPGSGVSIVDWVLSPWVSALSGSGTAPVAEACQVVRMVVAGGFAAAAQFAARAGKRGQVQCQK